MSLLRVVLACCVVTAAGDYIQYLIQDCYDDFGSVMACQQAIVDSGVDFTRYNTQLFTGLDYLCSEAAVYIKSAGDCTDVALRACVRQEWHGLLLGEGAMFLEHLCKYYQEANLTCVAQGNAEQTQCLSETQDLATALDPLHLVSGTCSYLKKEYDCYDMASAACTAKDVAVFKEYKWLTVPPACHASFPTRTRCGPQALFQEHFPFVLPLPCEGSTCPGTSCRWLVCVPGDVIAVTFERLQVEGLEPYCSDGYVSIGDRFLCGMDVSPEFALVREADEEECVEISFQGFELAHQGFTLYVHGRNACREADTCPEGSVCTVHPVSMETKCLCDVSLTQKQCKELMDPTSFWTTTVGIIVIFLIALFGAVIIGLVVFFIVSKTKASSSVKPAMVWQT